MPIDGTPKNVVGNPGHAVSVSLKKSMHCPKLIVDKALNRMNSDFFIAVSSFTTVIVTLCG